jgi:hypothetical protein
MDMVRTLPTSLAAAALIAATPFALQAQQNADASQADQPGRRWYTTAPATHSEVTIINLKVTPARGDSAKAEKTKGDKADKNDKKKKGAKALKGSSNGIQAEDRDESASQTWETEFMVDHEKDRMIDWVAPATTK